MFFSPDASTSELRPQNVENKEIVFDFITKSNKSLFLYFAVSRNVAELLLIKNRTFTRVLSINTSHLLLMATYDEV